MLTWNPIKREILSSVFRSQLPQIKKVEFNVETQALGENGCTDNDYTKRIYAAYERNG